MNKIFKVIWSKSKQCYIVVSEMAKNHSGKKKIVVASILAAMAVGSSVVVEAAPGIQAAWVPGTVDSHDSISLGSSSYAYGGTDTTNNDKASSVSVGKTAKSNGAGAIAIGDEAEAGWKKSDRNQDTVSYGIAIGRKSKSTDDYGISIGFKTISDLHGIAMGEQARAIKEGATTFGVSSRGYGKGAIAVGWQALAGADVYTAGVPGKDINNDSSSKINDYNKWGDMSVGLRALATGGNATALGRNAAATATNAVAIGGGNGNNYDDNTERTQATAEKAVAIGYKALASDKNATSIGTDAQASKVRSTAIGYEVRATGNNAVAIGSSDTNARKVVAAGESAIAVGTKAQANNDSSTAIGKEALAGNTNAIALGTSAEGKGASSTAIGNSAQATKTNAIALGTGADASEEQAVAIGKGATAEQTNAVALGTSATSGGANGVAIGNDAQAQANDTIAVGSTSRAENVNDSAFGNAAKASGGGSTAIGYIVKTTGNQAFGAGSNSEVSGTAAIGIGYKVTASGNRSISIGNDNGVIQTQASGEKAIAIGSGVQSTGSASTAIGKGAIASQDNAFAAGTEAKAQATDTVAIGSGVTASGLQSISIGSTFNNITNQATGEASIAIGAAAQSKGAGSVALGRNVQALEKYTTAVGMNITASDNASASTILGYNSYTKANQSVNIGSTVKTEAGGQYSTAIGYTLSVSGKNAIGIGSSDDGIADDKKLMATGESSIAIGTRAQGKATGATAIGKEAIATASSAMALGTNANAALAHSVALGEGSTTTEADGAGKIAYLTNESTNNSGNGVISVGNKRNASDTGTITRRIVSVAGGTDDYDAVNVKQLKALEANERHIKVKTGNAAYTPDANGKITLNYVNGKGEDVPNEVTEIKDVAKKSDEWTLRTQDGNTTAVATPQTVNGLTKKAVTLKAGDNIAIENNNGVVTIKAKDVVKSVATDNTNALDISNTNGSVKINPKLASSVNAAGEANKLVTAGTVKTALDDKIDKTAEMHIKSGEYTVNTDGTASLTQQNGNNQDQTTRVTIKDIAKKSVVDTLQSDYNTFKMKAITFTGDDTQGVARTLDTTLTVKGGANYTSTTPNTNIRVEKDAANGANGLLVKLSDKLSGMKEIAGTGSQDLVIKNGNTTVTVKAPANGDKGTVDFGNAKVVAPNLDASIKYRANDDAVAKAKSVKLADGFNFVASKDATTTAEGPKSGLAIKAEDNGKVTFGLDKATREKVDNAADKNLSNLSDTGKDKVKELAKTAAQDAVKVANGINTTVEKDTATAGVTTYKVNANDTTVAVTGNGLAITGGELGTDKVRKYSLDLSAATKGKLKAVDGLSTVIGGTNITADGTVTGPTFSITKADGTAENAGTIKEAIEKLDAANKGQNTKISDTADKVTKLATALGGGAKVENGTFTGPTYNITKDDGSNTKEAVNNVGDAISKLDGRINNANTTLANKGLDFYGNKDAADTDKVHRNLGQALKVKGAENFTRAEGAKNNIDVVKNTAGDGFDVKLAENLAKMKEISGDGTSDLVIKNGDTKVTVKAPTSGDKGTVDFGDAKVIAKNLDASIAYKAGNGDTKKTVKLQDGFNFTTATETTTTAEGPKSGLAITTGDNGVVTFGLDKATRSTIDNAADKDLSNLSDTGKTTVKELAKGAAQDAVKVADGINTTVEKDTATAGVTTYKVNANDTTVAVTGDGLAITGGDLGTDKVRKYSLDLSAATKGKLKAVDGLSTVIGGTNITADGTVTGPTFSITKADGTNETANTLKDAIDKLNATNAGQNTKISETAGKVTTLEGKVDGIVEKGMVFAGDDAATDKVTRKLGETLNIHGQNNITVKKDATAADTLNVKLASELKNITSISSGDGTTGSTVTLGAEGVSIANTKDGATKTVTIGKDGINAGGMKITNVAEATENGDAANKKYVDDAISNLGNIVSGNATLNFAGNVTKDAQDKATEKVGLSLATGTLHVNGASDEITTTAKGDTITVGLAKAVKDQLAKVGDTASNGRDGVNGTSGAQGLTGKDGLNDKTLTEKVNALRNGEAGSVVYTDENGARLVKAKDGQYYKTTDVDKDGNVLNGAKPATTVEARLVNPNGETTAPTKLSNIADGKVAAGSKEAVNGGQLNTVKTELATALGGGAKVENGTFTGPTYNITKADGTGTETASNVGEAISKLDTRITTANGALVTKGLDFTGNDTTAKVHRDLGTILTIKGADNFTRADAETNNIKVVKNNDDLDVKLAENLGNIKSISSATGEGKPGSTITLGADGVTIANTAAGQGGAAGETKTVTIGKDGINAGGMKITNVAEATNDGDAANKKYVDNAISNLNTTVTNNANLRYAGDTNEGAKAGEDHLNLPLATGTLKVAGTADQIKTVANNGTITLSLDEKVTNKLDKLGDTASNGRDGKDGASGAQGLTGKDGLNDKTLTEKVNALRNGEAGSVVYTDENGARLVKAKDGQYYKTTDVDKDGNVLNGAKPATTVEARLVNPNGETTAPTKLSNIADGKVAAGSKEAVNGGQLNTVKTELATALGGGAKVENGTFTGPTYNITKDDGTGTEPVNNVGAAISKLDGRINNANTVLGNKGLDFYGNKDAADTDKVHRNLGEALKVKGAENFTREANAKNNIDVVKNTAGDGFDVKLADNLGNIKEIAGNGKDNLVIKNGDATITLKPKKEAEGTNPATPATVDFGDTKVVASNLDASIKYRANDEEVGKAKSVKLADGFNFVASNVTDTTTEGPKSGIAIKAEDNGKVTFGLDKATRTKVDNAADKDLSNLTVTGKDKVKELAGEAAKASVKVADGINTTVTTDTTTTSGVTTYKVNANDTTVAVNADSLAIAGGDLDATTKVRAYTLDLSDTVKAKLNAINNVGDTASNGRDGVNGTSSAQGLTGKDGLNGKTLTEKVNALRNGEAGSVVYTNDAGDRVVKAKDGKYYKADEVKADGTVKTAEENKGKAPEEVKIPQARVVNPNGETTAPTTLSNIADGKVAANSKDAVNGGQLHTVKSDLATALGGDSKVDADGSFTGPTYNITKDDGSNKTEAVNNVGAAISKLDGRINNANTVLGNKGLDFYGNKDAADTDKVHRNLGEALKVKGAENFTREANAKNNIDVVKNTAGDGFDVKLADNLGNIKEIAGNGKDNLVIKNGDATITLKPKKEAEGTNPATPATVDFGNTKVVASNLDASITYRANSAEDADAKTVKLQKGLNFVSGDGTTATAETAKAGITIAADKDGKVVFGLNEATRNAIDNAADKNLSNLSDDGKNKVKELAKTAAQESVKVASGNNVTVTPETKDGVTTYTVNGRDTTVKAAENGSVSVSGGTLNDKGEREYTVDLTDAAKAEIAKVAGIDKRLGEAEKAIADNKTAINTNKDNIKANKDAIDANKKSIDANKKAVDEDIKALKGNTATKDLDNVSDKGKEVITGLIDVKGENGVTVTSAPDTKSKVKTFTVKIGDSATFGKGDKAVAIDGTKGSVTVGDKDKANTAITPKGVTVTTKNADGTDKSKVEIKDGTISGLTNTDWDPTKVATAEDAKKDPTSATAKERGKAATQGQIKDVVEKIVNGRGFEGDDNKKVSIALGDTLGIKGGATGPLTDNNIGVVSTEAKDGKPATMTVKLAKDVKMKDGSTSYDYYLPEIKTNPDGSKETVKNADGSVKYKLGKDGNPIRLVTTTVNGEGVTIAPVKGLDKPTVSLTADGLDNGGNQIHNVAAGTANTDAATVGQVRAAAHALNNRVNEAGAHAAALAAMNPLSYDPLKKSQVMAGVGSYKGNKALALGVAHYANEDTLFNVGVAVGDGSNMVNAGVTYRFGGEDSAVPERYKGGPISSVYVMQDEVSALKAENAEMKEQMKMLMERIEMLAKK